MAEHGNNDFCRFGGKKTYTRTRRLCYNILMAKKLKFIDYGRHKNVLSKNIAPSLGFSAFLFIISFVLYLDFAYLGVRNREVEDFVFANYKLLVLWVNVKILLTYLAVGLMMGLFTVLLNLEKKRYVLLFNGFFWFMTWIRGIKMLPQMFVEQLYRKGGIAKYFQVLITDFVPFIAIYIIFAGVIFAVAIKKKRVVAAFVIMLLSFLMVVRFGVAPADGGKSSHSRGHPNVLILAADSLRPQSLGYNGYHRKTPNIDRLFGSGVNFLNAKASVARTLPSWTSILTSMYPPDHQLRHMFPQEALLERRWATIIDVFNRHDYYTSVVSDFAGDIFPDMDYGFQRVTSPELRVQDVLKQRSLEIHYFLLGFLVNPGGRTVFPEMWGMARNKDPWYLTHYAKRDIKKAVEDDRPFFLLYFNSNNHFPYVTTYPYYNHYTRKGYYGKHKYGLSTDIMESFMEAGLHEDEVPRVVDHYDNATKLFDDNVGELLDYLKKSKLDKNTIVIIMSDHGESLYDEEGHGLAHGDHLLGQYANNMVFGVYSPFEDFKGLRVTQTVRDIDIAPTILDLLKIRAPDTFRGHSLAPVMRGEVKEFGGYPAYMETGVWYSPATPFIKDKVRIPYPAIIHLLDINYPSGKVSMKPQYESLVIGAKYKAYQLNGQKYIYMPGENEYREQFFIDEKLVAREDIDDPGFLAFKEKMVEMFKDKFYIDEKGFIRERIRTTGKQ